LLLLLLQQFWKPGSKRKVSVKKLLNSNCDSEKTDETRSLRRFSKRMRLTSKSISGLSAGFHFLEGLQSFSEAMVRAFFTSPTLDFQNPMQHDLCIKE
ncbi:hypothetical protein UO91_23995, partial [Enterobacter hormaechei]